MYTTTTEPDLQRVYWREDLVEWLPRLLGAIAILVVAWILARAAKWAIAKVVDRVPALRHHNETEPGRTVGSLIGEIAFWLILLTGIMFALQPLGLTQVLDPVRQLTTNSFAFIPNLIAAGCAEHFFGDVEVRELSQSDIRRGQPRVDLDREIARTVRGFSQRKINANVTAQTGHAIHGALSEFHGAPREVRRDR